MPDIKYEISYEKERSSRPNSRQTHMDYYGEPAHDDDPIEYSLWERAVLIA